MGHVKSFLLKKWAILEEFLHYFPTFLKRKGIEKTVQEWPERI